MNIDEFYMKVNELLPFKSDKELHFRKRMRHALSIYKVLLNDFVKELPVERETLLKDVEFIIEKINKMVENCMAGRTSTGYAQLANLLRTIERGNRIIPKIDIKKTILQFDSNVNFYRIRILNSIIDVPRKEMFHIPLDMRGIIKTQRYSIPGYPCLYLGYSIYGCWEEMHQPPTHTCAVSRFTNTIPLNFIDLTIPSKEDFKNPEYLKLLPLIIASMIQVAETDATYKPEYIVPQLLMEWVLKNREYMDNGNKTTIHGIAYTSTRKHDGFDFPNHVFINYAIPVFSVGMDRKYCKKLCEYFKLTLPTTNEIEKLKQGFDLDSGRFGLNEEEQREQNYRLSDFGNLEKRLTNEQQFPLYSIDYKGKDVIP